MSSYEGMQYPSERSAKIGNAATQQENHGRCFNVRWAGLLLVSSW